MSSFLKLICLYPYEVPIREQMRLKSKKYKQTNSKSQLLTTTGFVQKSLAMND